MQRIRLFSSKSSYLILKYFFFFNDTATTEIYTLSLHDALPISPVCLLGSSTGRPVARSTDFAQVTGAKDRKSTRLNSSHGYISYAVFCLKKKQKQDISDVRNSAYHFIFANEHVIPAKTVHSVLP